jgi:hypothetical protein
LAFLGLLSLLFFRRLTACFDGVLGSGWIPLHEIKYVKFSEAPCVIHEAAVAVAVAVVVTVADENRNS